MDNFFIAMKTQSLYFILPPLVVGTTCFTSRDGVYTHRFRCENNDTYCGEWDLPNKIFKPVGCDFREITTENAQKCFKGKTLACLGDSLMMGLCNGLGMVLMGIHETEDAADHYYVENMKLGLTSCAGCPGFSAQSDYVGNFPIIPSAVMRDFNDYDWQIQSYFFEFHGSRTVRDEMVDILNNKFDVPLTNTSKTISEMERNMKEGDVIHRKADFALVNYGMHVRGRFNTTPGRYGQDYLDNVVQEWIDIREKVEVPSVWTSMNGNCKTILHPEYQNTNQANVIEEANYACHSQLPKRKLPYFDHASVSRSPQRCQVSRDGVHIHDWAELARAKMLLNYLCDDDWNWVGDPKAFIDESLAES